MRLAFAIFCGAIFVALIAIAIKGARDISSAIDRVPSLATLAQSRASMASLQRSVAGPGTAEVAPQRLQSEAELLDDARLECEKVVRGKIRDPQFEDYRQNEAKRLTPREFEVQVRFLTRGDFNVLRPSVIDCKIGLNADSWSVISLKTIPGPAS
jgi:hypothetical protein